jgi:hypothetical protein
VNEILFDKPLIKIHILKNGNANWDITKKDTNLYLEPVADTSESNFSLKLKTFQIKNADITYKDDESNLNAVIENFTHQLKGEINNSEYAFNMQNTIEKLSFTMSGIKYLNKVNTKFNADITANMDDMKFTFAKNELYLNALMLGFDGWFQLKDKEMLMDIKYNTSSSDFKDFISLIPAIYAKDFESITSSGKLLLRGFFKGIYSDNAYPQFDFVVKVDNGNFQYAGMPLAMSNVNIDFKVFNQSSTLDNTKIDLSKLSLQLGKDVFSAKLFAENLHKDPFIDFMIKGSLELENIMKLIPPDEAFIVSGLINMDIFGKGNLSTIEKGNYESFNASGNLNVNNLKYASSNLPNTFYLNNLILNFTPQKVLMPTFDAKVGASDIALTGELSNFFSYIFSDGIIKGNLNIKSKLINANEFLTESTKVDNNSTTTDTSSVQAPEIPSNIDFTLNGNIAKLIYTNMEIANFAGQIKISNQKLSFINLAMQTLGANISMNGFYETTNPESPSMEMEFRINNMDIQKSFSTFNTIKKLAPIAENMYGTFSVTFYMKTLFDNLLSPNYESLFAIGNIIIPNAQIKDVKVFTKVADVLNYEPLKQPVLQNVNLAFTVEDGKVITKPFDIIISNQKLTLSGNTGLDESINYTGNTILPKSALGVVNNSVNSTVAKVNSATGTNVKMSEKLPITLKIRGTFADPKVETNLSSTIKQESGNVKNQLIDEANQKKAELELKAKAELDKQKAELERQKKEAEAKVKAEYEKQKADAEAKAKVEAETQKEKLKKQAEEEAKKKIKGVFR